MPHRVSRKRREREEGIEDVFEETMTKNFCSLVKEIDIQVQEAQNHKQNKSQEVHNNTNHN